MLGFSALGEVALGELADASAAISADAATIVVAGNDVGLYANRVVTAEMGAFVVTFCAVELARGRAGLSVRSGGGVRGLRAGASGGGKGLRISA